MLQQCYNSVTLAVTGTGGPAKTEVILAFDSVTIVFNTPATLAHCRAVELDFAVCRRRNIVAYPAVGLVVSRFNFSCVAGILYTFFIIPGMLYRFACSLSRFTSAAMPEGLNTDIKPLLSHSTAGVSDSPPKYVRTLNKCQSSESCPLSPY